MSRAPETFKRRQALLDWLREPARGVLSTNRIAYECPAYKNLNWYASPYERAYGDLTAMERKGLVKRHGSRPSLWEAV